MARDTSAEWRRRARRGAGEEGRAERTIGFTPPCDDAGLGDERTGDTEDQARP